MPAPPYRNSPAVPPLRPEIAPEVARQRSASVVSVAVMPGSRARSCATTPATCGAAIDVPEIVEVWVSEPDQAEVMPHS